MDTGVHRQSGDLNSISSSASHSSFNFCLFLSHVENEHLQAKQVLNTSMINYCLRYVTNCLNYRTIKGLCFNYIDFTLSPPG